MKQKMAATSSGEPAAAAGDNAIRALSALFISARPAQWVKNLVLPLPFLFGGALATGRAAGRSRRPASSSSARSRAAIYLVNDVMDRERDRGASRSSATGRSRRAAAPSRRPSRRRSVLEAGGLARGLPAATRASGSGAPLYAGADDRVLALC